MWEVWKVMVCMCCVGCDVQMWVGIDGVYVVCKGHAMGIFYMGET